MLIAISFSLGSMLGPVTGGILIDYAGRGSIYYAIGFLLLAVVIAGGVFKGVNAESSTG
ncbi:hypothetical protein [Geomicrobium sp. JCM 19039]|uniref:hypothetical protein n=1 Tax=Geomicrobium sp. JCM 19039 TaxID=1460636 RepID=UPI001EE64520|nr:hypothetical protein [Geomicrobium sp. JCM 19039]